MKILLNGAKGKMGQAIREIVSAEDTIIERKRMPVLIDENIDIGIDFSSPQGTMEILELALQYGFPLVIGTTGLTAEQRAKLHAAAQQIKILYARNFSIGVYVFRKLIRMAVQSLPEYFQIELLERHHKHKKDAPSGTAQACMEDIQAIRDVVAVYGRHGQPTVDRKDNEIGVHSLRGGEIFGEHRLFLTSDHEELVLEHRAFDRLAFAQGALLASRWLLQNSQKSGFFTLDDVL